MTALHVVFYVLWLETTTIFLVGLYNPNARFISALRVPTCSETLESESGAG